MNKPTIITTPSGDRMAVVPLADYERLIAAAEDAADVRAYDRAKRRLATGEDEMIPADVAKRLIAGENKIRVWREHRGLSSKALAQATGLAAAYLSQIENGVRAGTLATYQKIAAALRVRVDDLV
jgi:DNA-binding XRE family transcriptional regulator